MKNKKIAIIICSYNQDKLLKKCLSSLKRKTKYKNYKVFLIDDSGTGKFGKGVKKSFKWADVTIKDKNTGFSSSNNIGIKKALKSYNPDYFLLLNDDTEIIDENWLEELIKAGEENNKVGILGCKVLNPDKTLQWPNWIKNKEKIQEISNVIGCCLMFKKQVIDKIGFLDEKFDPVYGEETDFCFRAKKAGFKIKYTPNSRIIHYGKISTKKMESNFIWFIKKRNAIRLEFLNMGVIEIIIKQIIHFGSAIFSKKPFNNLKLLFKAYLTNIKNRKEILSKRRKRNIK